MNILILADNKINESQLKQVKAEVALIYKKNTDIKLNYVEEWRDLSNVPKEWYTSTDEGIKKSFIAETTKEIYSRYKDRLDQVVFLIHRDNWNLTGVWGWNLSKIYNGYSIQQCRFDNRNLNNSIGTLYHEFMHDHDSFIYTFLGTKIENKVLVKDWDDDVVHGGKYSKTTYGWDYIRYNENQPALELIGDDLKSAIAKKRSAYAGKEKELLQMAVILLRQLIAERRGDIAIKSNNKCVWIWLLTY